MSVPQAEPQILGESLKGRPAFRAYARAESVRDGVKGERVADKDAALGRWGWKRVVGERSGLGERSGAHCVPESESQVGAARKKLGEECQ